MSSVRVLTRRALAAANLASKTGSKSSFSGFRATHWEKKWVKVGHMQLYRWSPSEKKVSPSIQMVSKIESPTPNVGFDEKETKKSRIADSELLFSPTSDTTRNSTPDLESGLIQDDSEINDDAEKENCSSLPVQSTLGEGDDLATDSNQQHVFY